MTTAPGAEPAPPAMDLVTELAHDFRTPLTSILFLTDTLRSGAAGDVSAEQREQLELIYSAALQLSTLANDLTDLVQHGRTGLLESEPVRFSLADIVHSVHDIVRPVAHAKALELTFDVEAAPWRRGHPAAVGRVLLNLVTNALKVTPSGSVRVIARETDADVIRFSVVDTGPGLPPTIRATLSGGDAPLMPVRFRTSGLGLVICHRLVRAMGGRMHVAPASPRGAQVSFELPLPGVG